MFGLPLADLDRLIGWKSAIVQLANTAGAQADPALLQAAAELTQYLAENVAARQTVLSTDLMSQLLADQEEGGMSNQEIIGLCFVLALAGLDTVTAAPGFTLEALGATQNYDEA